MKKSRNPNIKPWSSEAIEAPTTNQVEALTKLPFDPSQRSRWKTVHDSCKIKSQKPLQRKSQASQAKASTNLKQLLSIQFCQVGGDRFLFAQNKVSKTIVAKKKQSQTLTTPNKLSFDLSQQNRWRSSLAHARSSLWLLQRIFRSHKISLKTLVANFPKKPSQSPPNQVS